MLMLHQSLQQGLPLLLKFPAVHPTFHSVLLVLGSASEGTGRSVRPTQGLAPSVAAHGDMQQQAT